MDEETKNLLEEACAVLESKKGMSERDKLVIKELIQRYSGLDLSNVASNIGFVMGFLEARKGQ